MSDGVGTDEDVFALAAKLEEQRVGGRSLNLSPPTRPRQADTGDTPDGEADSASGRSDMPPGADDAAGPEVGTSQRGVGGPQRTVGGSGPVPRPGVARRRATTAGGVEARGSEPAGVDDGGVEAPEEVVVDATPQPTVAAAPRRRGPGRPTKLDESELPGSPAGGRRRISVLLSCAVADALDGAAQGRLRRNDIVLAALRATQDQLLAEHGNPGEAQGLFPAPTPRPQRLGLGPQRKVHFQCTNEEAGAIRALMNGTRLTCSALVEEALVISKLVDLPGGRPGDHG